jgi:hypothetical protein
MSPTLSQIPQQTSARAASGARRLALAVAGAASLTLGGCVDQIAASNCARVKSNELRVAAGQSCRFRYDGGDVARYVVKVTRQPTFGEAKGEGRYLHYVARRGFVGQDRLTIRVERRGVGHVQWQDHTVTVKVVGPAA